MLKWNDKPVIDKVMLATAKGMDSVMAKCVGMAKSIHPPNVITGTLQGSYRLEPTKQEAGELVGRWGSYGVLYAIFQELGTVRMPGGNPVLRPTADRFYPTLPSEIKRFMA